jgi:hypothetical protein
MSWLYHYTHFHKPSYKTLLSEQRLEICATVNVCGFTHSNILAVFTDYFDTPVSWDKHLRTPVDMVMNTLHYCLMFLLEEHLISSLGRISFSKLVQKLIYGWFATNWKNKKPTYKFAVIYSYRISSSLSFPQ